MIYISTHCTIAYIADEDVSNDGGNVDKVQEEPFGELTLVLCGFEQNIYGSAL